MVPASKPNLVLKKTSYTLELLCSSTVDPHQNATIITKVDSGATNNDWRTEYQIFLTDIKETPKWNHSTINQHHHYECNKDREHPNI